MAARAGGGGAERAGRSSERRGSGRRQAGGDQGGDPGGGRAGEEVGPRPRRDFPFPGDRRRGLEGRRRPRCVNPFGAPGPPSPRPRARPCAPRPGGSCPLLGGETRGPRARAAAQGHLARAGVAEPGLRSPRGSPPPPGTQFSPRRFPWSRPSFLDGSRTPPTSILPGCPEAPPFPSDPDETFPRWGKQRQTGSLSPSTSFCPPPFAPPQAGPPHPHLAVGVPRVSFLEPGLRGRGTGLGEPNPQPRRPGGDWAAYVGPQLWKFSLCLPRLGPAPPISGVPPAPESSHQGKACLPSLTSFLFIHQ